MYAHAATHRRGLQTALPVVSLTGSMPPLHTMPRV